MSWLIITIGLCLLAFTSHWILGLIFLFGGMFLLFILAILLN